jgi:hypothetical protein
MTYPHPIVVGDAAPDALLTDRYLDALLGAADRGADATPGDADLDPEIRRVAAVLRSSLVRVHPSFRFEDRLAARLAELATGRWERAAARGGEVVLFPGRAAREDPLLDAVLAGVLDPSDRDAVEQASGVRGAGRPLLVGGAITSAALSIVGVAIVAWRASRAGGSPASGGAMSREARTAHARRASVAGGAGGPA